MLILLKAHRTLLELSGQLGLEFIPFTLIRELEVS